MTNLIRASKWILALLVLATGVVKGQTVTITGKVVDPNGAPFYTGKAQLVSGNGSGAQSWTFGGTNPVNPTRPISGLDAYGNFSIDLMNTSLIDQQSAQPEWQFNFCSSGTPAPVVCFNVPALALTSSQSITAQINAVPPPLIPGSSANINLSSPPPIGNVTPNTGAFTTPAAGDNSTNAATTAFVARHAPCASILDNGGNNGGSVDNTAAFTATIAAQPSGNVCVYFPSGTYAFASQVSYSLPTTTSVLTILGAGADQSKLVWSAGGGLAITLDGPYSSFHVQNLSILTGTTNTGNGIGVTQTGSIPNPAYGASNDITNVNVGGTPQSSATNYWNKAISLVGVSNVNINGGFIWGSASLNGTGVYLGGASLSTGVAVNIFGTFLDGLQYGIYYDDNFQGLTLNAANLTGVQYGVYTSATAAGTDELTIGNSQFNCTVACVYERNGIANTLISNNLISVSANNGVGLKFAGAAYYAITGNSIVYVGSVTGTVGISILNSNGPGSITGNFLGPLANGLIFGAASANIGVSGNTYYQVTIPYSDASGNKNSYADPVFGCPTVSAGFGTSPAIVPCNGTNNSFTFGMNVGTGGTASSGTLVFPANPGNVGWTCTCDAASTVSTTVFKCHATTPDTTHVTLTNYSTAGTAAAWSSGESLNVICAIR